MLNDLPIELLILIFKFLDYQQIVETSEINQKFRLISKDILQTKQKECYKLWNDTYLQTSNHFQKFWMNKIAIPVTNFDEWRKCIELLRYTQATEYSTIWKIFDFRRRNYKTMIQAMHQNSFIKFPHTLL